MEGIVFHDYATTEAVGSIEDPMKSVNQQKWWIDMDVSENSGLKPPKSSMD